MSKTLIISNRLPVRIIEENNRYTLIPSEGGLATGLASVHKNEETIWIGWPGIDIPEERQPEVRQLLAELKLVPVFLSTEEINFYYEGFSNEILWPVFHYLVTYARFEQAYWDCYLSVNEKYAAICAPYINEEDKIWVHDYQLLCLPGLLRSNFPHATIGFFQHIPFPSFEIFRLIPWREELINGMLGADLIGFHTYDDASHFLNTASRLLPVHFSGGILIKKERQIMVDAFPMGIDYEKFEHLPGTPGVRAEIELLKADKKGKMILSVDRLDYSKGILERLRSFELLLQIHPEYIGEISLFMIVVPSRDTVTQYNELREQIDQLVGNINARFRGLDWIPVNYFYRSFPVEVLSALYNVAEVCLVSPMRDGMNLVSKEYVASRTDNTGVLILSEMAGASKELNDALIVNPNNLGHIMNAIVEALDMPLAEQQKRMSAMRNVVKKFDVKRWIKNFFDSLAGIKARQQALTTKYAVNALNTGILDKYQHATARTIFLDYDGTLVGFSGNIDEARPDAELYEIIQRLSDDPLNTVVIISGRQHETLSTWFDDSKVDLIAEHGAWKRQHGKSWNAIPMLTTAWKQEIYDLLEEYTDRTPGSFIEEKTYSLVWHYRKVEEGLGELRASDIVNSLRILAADRGVQLMPGNKVLEFRNMEVNKGKAALNWLHNKETDFILAMGDDHTDEDTFKALPDTAVTIKVGSNMSEAKYYLNDFKEVRQLLWSIINMNHNNA